MGSSNRDYFRDDDPYGSSWDPTGGERPPMSLPAKIGVLFGVLFIFTSLYPPAMPWLALSRDTLASGRIWTLLTYAFVSPLLGAIGTIFACLIVYSFGLMMQEIVGTREFVLFILASTLFGGVAHVLTMPLGTGGSTHIIDALLLWLALRRPHQTINLFFLFTVPLWGVATVFIGLSIAMSLRFVGAAYAPDAGSFFVVGFPSLLGCLCFAFMHERFRWRLSSFVGPNLTDALSSKLKSRRTTARARKTNLQVFAPDDEPDARSQRAAEAEARTAEEVDRILQKIHEQGEASLSGKERRLLAKESKRLRGKS